MIRLFRHVRKKLIEKENLRKYLLYIVGEVALVVIGILIALQVSNLNEDRKVRQFEEEILSLIDQNLQADAEQLNEILEYTNEVDSLTDRLIHELEQENYDDSVNVWMGKIVSFERFKSQSSAFEVLKARGIESVSSKELQLALIAYYDQILFGVYQSLTDVEKSFNADWVPVIKEDFMDFKWKEVLIPVDSEEFFNDPSAVVLFKLYQDNRNGSVDDLEGALQKISEIRTLISLITK